MGLIFLGGASCFLINPATLFNWWPICKDLLSYCFLVVFISVVSFLFVFLFVSFSFIFIFVKVVFHGGMLFSFFKIFHESTLDFCFVDYKAYLKQLIDDSPFYTDSIFICPWNFHPHSPSFYIFDVTIIFLCCIFVNKL